MCPEFLEMEINMFKDDGDSGWRWVLLFFPPRPIIFVFLMLIILKQAKRVLLVIYLNLTFL